MKQITLLSFLIILSSCIPINQPNTINSILQNKNVTLTSPVNWTETPTYIIPSITPSVTPPNILLPRKLYYVKKDNKTGLSQIFMLSRECKNEVQVTFEQSNITYFDVSQFNGEVTYVEGNKLILQKKTGEKIIIDNNLPESILIKPIWSYDGKSIAYYNNGINIYSIDTKSSIVALKNEKNYYDYFPISFSPNSEMILFKSSYSIENSYRDYYIFHINGGYYSPLAESIIVRDEGMDMGFMTWSRNSQYIFLSAYAFGGSGEGMMIPGLIELFITGNERTVLISEINGNNSVLHQVMDPWDDYSGVIYFLYAKNTFGEPSNVSYKMAKIANQDQYVPEIIREENIEPTGNPLYDIWIPDGSGLLLTEHENQGLKLILIPTNPNLPIENIYQDTSLISSLHWGEE